MLNLVKTQELSPIAATTPISAYSKADGQFDVITRIHPDARVFLDHGVFFVGIQKDQGRLILGWGETVKQAVDAAIAKNEG